MRTCSKCREKKEELDFSQRNGWCKKCKMLNEREYRRTRRSKINARRRQFYRDNPEHYAAIMHKERLKRRYGLTVADYDQMFASQGGVCALCKRSCIRERRLSVDHCHTTGKVRGLLCVACNLALGYLKDSPTLFRLAAEYLERAEPSRERYRRCP